MKLKSLFPALILFLTLTSCDFKAKTPQEIYREKQQGKTDDELLNEILEKPMLYKVTGHSIKDASNYDFESRLIQNGAVLQVLFSKNSIYIERFGTYNGNYKQGYFANQNGTEAVTIFKNYIHPKAYDDSPLGRLKAKNETINVDMNLTLVDGQYTNTAKVIYILERM